MKFDSVAYRVDGSGHFGVVSLAAAILGLVISAWSLWLDSETFYYGYLNSFVFWVAIGLGGLFFTLLHHLSNATWSTVLRRMTESLALTLPFMAILFIPIWYGMHDLYHWTHEDVVAADKVLSGKAGYLNTGFFTLRTAVAFLIWSILAFALNKLSRAQDNEGKISQLMSMKRLSAGGMVLFAFSITMVAFDWLMSLDPHWFSTIYGLHFFVGSLLSVLALIILLASSLQKKKILSDIITVEHYHDLGKLSFAFIVFWAYISYSQYFIQWYGNIPEETAWYLHRWEGSWKGISLLIMFGHFVLPFLVLVFRGVKRNVYLLRLVAFWILFIRFVDLFWQIFPSHLEHGPTFSLSEVTSLVGPMLLVGGLFLWIFWNRFTSGPLIPVGDPKLKASISFVNH